MQTKEKRYLFDNWKLEQVKKENNIHLGGNIILIMCRILGTYQAQFF